jgi:hypothetical protein
VKNLILFALVASALAQAPQTTTPTMIPYTFDCTTLETPSSGCRSYNEMVTNGDKDLLGILDSTTYVCFRPMEDVFFTMSYSSPDYNLFMKSATSQAYEQFAFFLYARFKGGVVDESQMFSAKWKKFAKDGQTPIYLSISDPKRASNTSVSDSELSVQYAFTNRSNTNTTYLVTVRRSTLRFLETYEWENKAPSPKRSKGTSQVSDQTLNSPRGSTEFSGRCAYFPHKAE